MITPEDLRALPYRYPMSSRETAEAEMLADELECAPPRAEHLPLIRKRARLLWYQVTGDYH